ncbi:MAG: SirB2 family protein [Burkholderiales bacterium]
MVDYALLKVVHMTCALVSFVLFFLRGVWRFTESPLLQRRWVKVLPHVNDTILLLAAIGMALTVAAYPGMHKFLATKVVALLVYILLGLYAFRWAKSNPAQIGAWVLAQCVFLYVVAVAFTKSPSLNL